MNSHRRPRFGLFSRTLAVATLTALISTPCANPAQAEAKETPVKTLRTDVPFISSLQRPTQTIRVGVRDDAEPFSYLKPSRVENRILPRYGGYIVEICRTVLRQMVSGDVFQGFKVVPVPVNASNRFQKLANREVDLLCGPDSITTERLRLYNVSHPVFLSGIARVKVPTDRMPRSVYCYSILGLVAGTTSEQAGIQAMVEANLFGRFQPAIRQYLRYKAEQNEPQYRSTLAASWNRFSSNLGLRDQERKAAVMHSGSDDVIPGSIVTSECPSGYNSGPVVTYDTHSQGLQDLCAGRLLYYLGDVDIVKRNLPPGCDHVDIGQRTFTREAYGIYFRKPPRTAYKELDDDEQLDAILFTEFNYLLVLQMQSAERLLEIQYQEEFGDAEMAEDLQAFFRNLQYATDY